MQTYHVLRLQEWRRQGHARAVEDERARHARNGEWWSVLQLLLQQVTLLHELLLLMLRRGPRRGPGARRRAWPWHLLLLL